MNISNESVENFRLNPDLESNQTIFPVSQNHKESSVFNEKANFYESKNETIHKEERQIENENTFFNETQLQKNTDHKKTNFMLIVLIIKLMAFLIYRIIGTKLGLAIVENRT